VLVAAEEVRVRLRRRLVEEYGVEEADMLLDHPPGGWGELVTRDWLQLVLDARFATMGQSIDARFATMGQSIDARFATMGQSIDARFATTEQRLVSTEERLVAIERLLGSMDSRLTSVDSGLRAQTWKLVGAMTAFLGLFIAAIKL
jgi:hypothetical protein